MFRGIFSGRQNDKYGNTAQWWTENTLKQYLSRAQCFTQKFNEFIVLNGTHVRKNPTYLYC